METIGSQKRETLSESGYVLWDKIGEEAWLVDPELSGNMELWIENDHHAGYVIEIEGIGHEFVRSVRLA